MRIHETLLCTVQVQSAALAATVTMLPLSPSADTATLPGLMVSEHWTPVWLMLNTNPAMDSTPVLLADIVLGATEYVTMEFPVPLLLDVIVIHEALLDASHAQPFTDVSRPTLPLPPLARTEGLGLMIERV